MRRHSPLGRAIVWKGETRPHARQDGQASLVRRTWNPAETKKARSVVALSCVTRFGRGRRFASGYWSVLQRGNLSNDWRFSGLLSGDPPTSTQPQARAKLGKGCIGSLARGCKKNPHDGPEFFVTEKPFVFNSLTWETRRASRAARPWGRGRHLRRAASGQGEAPFRRGEDDDPVENKSQSGISANHDMRRPGNPPRGVDHVEISTPIRAAVIVLSSSCVERILEHVGRGML